ncbi:DMT family transporter [Rhodococcus sp. HNM0569]|uniref:DMT family transporter n=1 Tax=Rhodococcus sp. HNM0569 TaxID=2716340 RepID=UPI003211DF50
MTPAGLGWGFLGVLAFSFTVPFTRIATGGMTPLFVAGGRAVVAGAAAAALLAVTRSPLPRGRQWLGVVVVALGVVAGFPLFTSFALTSVPASHAAVVIGILPAATAIVAVVRGGERPSPLFWVAATAGALVVTLFVTASSGGVERPGAADLLLVAAVVAAAFGYAEGGVLSRTLGSWQTICWALVVSLPAMLLVTAAAGVPRHATGTEWASFAYLALVSMFLGFFAWYRGLAIGPVATVGQIQLLQPVMTITWSALVLHETIGASVVVGALGVVACAAAAVTARVTHGDSAKSHTPDTPAGTLSACSSVSAPGRGCECSGPSPK